MREGKKSEKEVEGGNKRESQEVKRKRDKEGDKGKKRILSGERETERTLSSKQDNLSN